MLNRFSVGYDHEVICSKKADIYQVGRAMKETNKRKHTLKKKKQGKKYK